VAIKVIEADSVEAPTLVTVVQDYQVLLRALLFLEAVAVAEEAQLFKAVLLVPQLLEELTELDKAEHRRKEHLILVEELVVLDTTVTELLVKVDLDL
jgi:hypothetical protein